MSEPLVSYVIVTMNRQREVVECLISVREQDCPRKQVIVVDNGSSDGTVSQIRQRFPDVRLISLPSNHGVAGGRNHGAAAASGEICVFIDDDARFTDPDATRRIIPYFQKDPKLACLALVVSNGLTGFEDCKAIPRADKLSLDHDYPCAYFCGAGFAVRREALLEVGLFWDRLMYGGEELDLSYRLLDRGYRLLRTASVTVLHDNVLTARRRGQQTYFYIRNRCWVAARNLPWLYVLTTTGLWWGYLLLAATARRELSFAVQGIWDALRGFPAVLCERQRIRRDTVQALRRLSGRLWY